MHISACDEPLSAGCTCNSRHHHLIAFSPNIYVFIFLKLLGAAVLSLFFFLSMLPNWSRPESFWQSKWQDDRLGRQSKGSERSFWTAPCYLLFLCRIIILRLFTPWTLIGIANADVQWLSIRIKDANNVKWGHVSKAAPFPWLFITPSSAENFIITEAVLYLVETHAAFTLFFQGAVIVLLRYQGRAAAMETLHYTTRGKVGPRKFGAAILWRKFRKMERQLKAKQNESQEQERLWGKTASWSSATAAEKRRGRRTGRQMGGGQNNWIINEKDAF